MERGMARREVRGWAAMLAVAFTVKLCMDALPDEAVKFAFMRPAAHLAASYLGTAFDFGRMTLSARGVTIEVVRACSATDFFAMIAALFVSSGAIRSFAFRMAASIPAAWLIAVLANAVRFVLLVFVDGFFPASQIPAVHMAVGIAVFLPVFAVLWYNFAPGKESRNGNAHKN